MISSFNEFIIWILLFLIKMISILLQPASLISIFSLLFTICSFWWMNWREGKLHFNIPEKYIFKNYETKAEFLFPFIIYNDGPTPITIYKLQIQVRYPQNNNFSIYFTKEFPSFACESRSASIALPFIIPANQAKEVYLFFETVEDEIILEPLEYSMNLLGIYGKKKRWKNISKFPLCIPNDKYQNAQGFFTLAENISERKD